MKDYNVSFGTLLLYEIKKIVMNRFTVIVMIILTGYSLMQGIYQAEQSGDYASAKQELRQGIDGREINDELLTEIADAADEDGVSQDETNRTYEGLAGWVRDVMGSGTPLAECNAEKIYQTRRDIIKKTYKTEELSDSEKEYWKKERAKVKEPFTWHDAYESLGIIEIVESTPFVMLFMITLFISQVFAGEVKNQTDPLLRCTRGGLKTTYLAKITAAFIYSITLTLYSLLIAIGTSIILWGNSGWDTAIQIILPFTDYNMTLGELTAWLIAIVFASTVLLTAFTCFLSECVKSSVLTMATVFGVFFTILVDARQIPLRLRLLSQILYLLSPTDMSSPRVLYEFRLIGWNGHFLTAWQFAPVLYITISLALIVIGRFIFLKRSSI